MLKDAVWITWEKQTRNRSLASRLQVELFEITIKSNRFTKYFKAFYFTHNIIRSKLPKIVIAQNPSIVLGYVLLFLRKIYKFSLISDAHLAGIQALNGIYFFQWVLDNYNKRANLVIVTNDAHSDYVRLLGGKAFICQDPLPLLPEATDIKNIAFQKAIFFICSFDVDEPYEEVFEAFDILRGIGYSLFVSGNYKKANIDVNKYPNINFLGFVPDNIYYGYLKQCAIVVVLTTMENCLVCGAYEALSAGKPVIVSNTKVLKAYFATAAVFLDNSSNSIANSIIYAYENRKQLSLNIKNWVIQNNRYMEVKIKNLKSLIVSMINT